MVALVAVLNVSADGNGAQTDLVVGKRLERLVIMSRRCSMRGAGGREIFGVLLL